MLSEKTKGSAPIRSLDRVLSRRRARPSMIRPEHGLSRSTQRLINCRSEKLSWDEKMTRARPRWSDFEEGAEGWDFASKSSME